MMSLDRIKKKLGVIYEDYVARIFHKECKIGPDDVIIASYPRSGRTWVRFFIGSYINHLYGLGIDVTWDNFAMLSPGYLCNERDGLLLFPKDVPRVIFSHNKPIGRYFPGRKVIYITRNFVDILVSYYFFHKHRESTQHIDLSVDDFVREEFNFPEAIDRLNYFSGQLEKAEAVLMMPYESMRTVPEHWFKKLLQFANYEYDQAAFQKALEHSSFSSMRRMEREQRGYGSEEKFHTRRGGFSEATNYLSEETIAYVQSLLYRNLRGILKEYYLGHGFENEL